MTNRRKSLKQIALVLAVSVFYQAVFPTLALALTGGPTQPEMSGFKQIGATDMVDLFTGDFSYNIPLMDVGGYPLNLVYHSDPGMEEEASWVGLGWSLNPGVMRRDVRGFPDDFKGEEVKKEFNIKDNVTVGVTAGAGAEFAGWFKPNLNFGVYHNTYTGYGINVGLVPAVEIGKLNFAPSLSFSSNTGVSTGLEIEFLKEAEESAEGKTEKITTGLKLGLGVNSRQGMRDLSISYSKRKDMYSVRLSEHGAAYMNHDKSLSGSLGGSISFARSTYFPTANLPFSSESFTFRGTVGGNFLVINPHLSLNGYATTQKLAFNEQTQRAYGTLFMNEAQIEPSSLMDYNSNTKVAFSTETPDYPIQYGTYDLFSASGQGLSGQFRATRNDIGMLRDPLHLTSSVSGSLGVELGIGNLVHTGFDADVYSSNTSSGFWKEENEAFSALKYSDYEGGLSEPVYFKNTGEPTGIEPGFYNTVWADDPFHVGIQRKGPKLYAKRKLVNGHNGINEDTKDIANEVLKKEGRERRNQVFSYLTAEEASKAALDKKIYSYPSPADLGTPILPCEIGDGIEEIDRLDEQYQPHHISEVTVTETGGTRYMYGIPAYNTLQKEFSFAVDPGDDPPSGGLISYTSVEKSFNNESGEDHFFESQSIPPYAHSYLLTSVLSSDYVDVTGDGISDDDQGTAVKFNYSRVHRGYKWRTPVEENKARHHEGLLSDPMDDKASFFYGEKEIWYVHSIESRTHVARFYTSVRNDGAGVVDENGGTQGSPAKLHRLDSIQLYSKSELLESSDEAVPLKTVHFRYAASSQELCQGVPNNLNGGKLTLERIFFTYEDSRRGRLNSYEFSYKDSYNSGNTPFDYDLRNMDRWGNYKKQPGNYPDPDQFPYVVQDEGLANEFAAAWSLVEIKLPSGGIINVEYEPDDYAYVQDVRAGQMVFVEGFTDDIATPPTSDLFYDNSLIVNDYLVAEAPYWPWAGVNHISQSVNAQYFGEALKRYFEDVNYIYFSCLVSLDGGSQNDERITGYARFLRDDVEFKDDKIFIPIRTVKVRGGEFIHPISVAALQKTRLERPELAYPSAQDGSVGDVILRLGGLFQELNHLFKGFEVAKLKDGWAKNVRVDESWIRLANPTYKKFGGSSRVKSLTISDGWGEMAGQQTSTYGQIYAYEIEENTGGGLETISSGVAAYEPSVGNDENLWKEPVFYTERNALASNNYFFTEKPYGEALFPAPVVGYRKVEVRPFIPEVPASSPGKKWRNHSGYTVHEFNTAKDFPVITDATDGDDIPVRNRNKILDFLNVKSIDRLAVSYGYLVEVNNMHGKAKTITSFDDYGSEISKTTYRYRLQTSEENTSRAAKRVSNMVNVVNPDGSISPGQIGLDMDVWTYMGEDKNVTTGGGFQFNSFGFIIGIFPCLITPVLPKFSYSELQLKKSVTTKFIQRFGILEEVEVRENGSTIATENLLFDSETGAVLLTKTQNEFKDPVYSFTYPAHWAYDDLMGQAYKNLGATFSGVTISAGEITLASGQAEDFFVPGDELIIRENGVLLDQKFIVTKPFSDLVVIDEAGAAYSSTGDIDLKIVRSGRRNMASTALGSFTSLQEPVSNNNIDVSTSTEIIDAAAVEFNQFWQVECLGCDEVGGGDPGEGQELLSLLRVDGQQTRGRCIVPNSTGDSLYLGGNLNSGIWLAGMDTDGKISWVEKYDPPNYFTESLTDLEYIASENKLIGSGYFRWVGDQSLIESFMFSFLLDSKTFEWIRKIDSQTSSQDVVTGGTTEGGPYYTLLSQSVKPLGESNTKLVPSQTKFNNTDGIILNNLNTLPAPGARHDYDFFVSGFLERDGKFFAGIIDGRSLYATGEDEVTGGGQRL